MPLSPIKELRRINFMPRQKVMFSCLGIQEIRFGGLPECECAGGLAAEEDEVCEIYMRGSGWGGGFAEKATGGEDGEDGEDYGAS